MVLEDFFAQYLIAEPPEPLHRGQLPRHLPIAAPPTWKLRLTASLGAAPGGLGRTRILRFLEHWKRAELLRTQPQSQVPLRLAFGD